MPTCMMFGMNISQSHRPNVSCVLSRVSSIDVPMMPCVRRFYMRLHSASHERISCARQWRFGFWLSRGTWDTGALCLTSRDSHKIQFRVQTSIYITRHGTGSGLDTHVTAAVDDLTQTPIYPLEETEDGL